MIKRNFTPIGTFGALVIYKLDSGIYVMADSDAVMISAEWLRLTRYGSVDIGDVPADLDRKAMERINKMSLEDFEVKEEKALRSMHEYPDTYKELQKWQDEYAASSKSDSETASSD